MTSINFDIPTISKLHEKVNEALQDGMRFDKI